MSSFSRSGGNRNGRPDTYLTKYLAATVAILFAVVCIACMNTDSSSADPDGGTFGDLTWEFDGDHTLTISGTGPMEMPEEGYPWVDYSGEITSVVIGSGVTSISQSAFEALNNLASVDFGDTVQTIGDSAFSTSDLSSLVIPDSVTSIGRNAFSSNPIATLHVGKGLTSIGAGAFKYNCLTAITIDPENTSFAVQDNVLYSHDMTKFFLYPGGFTAESFAFPEEVTELADTFYNYKSELQSITLNANLATLCENPFEINSSTTISVDGGNSNFKVIDNSLMSYDGKALIKHFTVSSSYAVPDGVETICEHAFYNFQTLDAVTLPSSVVSIGESAFNHCVSLASVSGSGNVKTIGDYAFSQCISLESFTFGDDLLLIGESAFYNTNLFSIVVDGTEGSVLGYGAFQYCDYVETLTITGGFAIEEYVFEDCGRFGEGVTFTLGEGITSIGDYAFSGAKLVASSLTIPDSVTYVGDCAFSGANLTSLTIGTGVTEFGYDPFYGSSLTTLNYNAIACEDMTSLTIPLNFSDPLTVTFGPSVQIIPNYLLYSSSDVTNLTSVVIPDSVTTIGNRAFMHQAGITELTMSANVESIGTEAFNYCSGLTELILPASLTSVGQWAFSQCTGLSSVTYNAVNCASQPNVFSNSGVDEGIAVSFGDSVRSIPGNLFQYSKIGPTVTLPHGVTSIGEYAFQGCDKVVTVSIPDTVEVMGYSPFGNCSALRTINYDAVNGGSIYNYYEPFRNSGSEDPGITVNIGPHVVGIPSNIFSSTSNINVVNMGENVETIGSYAFNGASITAITIPSKVTQINTGAFNSCRNLASIVYNAEGCSDFSNSPFACYGEAAECEVTIGNGVLRIPARLFSGNTNITSVTMGTGVTYIGTSAFQDCTSITAITIPAPVETICDYAFQRCTGLTSVVYSAENCTSYGTSSAFSSAGAESGIVLTVSEGVTTIPNNAFSLVYKLKSVSLPSTLVTIGSSAFHSTGITSVVIPDEVTAIGNYAFDGTAITSLTIGKKVEDLGSYAFGSCETLESVTYNAIALNSYSNPFNDGDGYADFTLTIGSEVTTIPASLFYSLDRLTGPLVIPDSVLTIGSSAFYGCEGLTSVVFGNGLNTIGASAFQGCNGLATIGFGTGNLSIGSRAFEGCSGVASLTLPSNVASVAVFAFNGMSGLTQINFDTNAAFTGNNSVFNTVAPNCSVVFGDGVTTAPYDMFLDCANLKTIVFNDDLEVIEDYAFSGTGITSLVIPDSVRTIGFCAFDECSAITSITIPSTVETINGSAFNSFNFFDTSGDSINPVSASTIGGYKFTGTMDHMVMCDTGFSFVTNGGTPIDDLFGIEGKTVPAVANPTRPHYNFHMWYSDEELTTPYAITVFPDSHITLYALWIPDTYTVTFDINEGSPAVDPVEVIYPGKVSEPVGPFTKTGYTLTSWRNGLEVYDFSLTVDRDITLTAFWTANDYTITLDGNGATQDGEISVRYLGDINYADFTGDRTGYTLTGFFTEPSGGVMVVTSELDLVLDVEGYTNAGGKWIRPENVTLYAQWNPNVFGSALVGGEEYGQATFTFDSATVTSFTPATLAGYTCTGYYSAAVDGVLILSAEGVLQPDTDYTDAEGRWVFDNAVTLYAKWEANTVSVTLNGNGYGSTDGAATATYASPVITMSTAAARPGWTLTGYYSAAVDGVLILSAEGVLTDAETLYTEDGVWTGTELSATLYAHWSPLTYTLELGGVDTSGSAVVRSGDTQFSDIVAPTSRGYHLVGYATPDYPPVHVADGSGNLLPNVDGFTNEDGEWIYVGASSLQFLSQWIPNAYDIVLDRNGGLADGAATADFGSATAEITLQVSRVGYDLVGYFLGSVYVMATDGALIADVTDYTDGDGNWIRDAGATLTAEWIPLDYTVTLNKNGGDGGNVDVTVTFDSAIMDGYSAISKRGHTLTGYFTAAEDGVKVMNDDGSLVFNVANYTDASGWIRAEDTVLYAQWVPNVYTIVLDGNGPGAVSGSASAVFGAPLSAITDATREGYTLTGYFTSAADGTKVINTDGSLVADVDGYTAGTNWDLADDARLYAQWAAGTYTVTYVVNGGVLPGEDTLEVTFGQYYELDEPTHATKYFAGWKDDSDKIYTLAGTWSTANDVTLTAQWADTEVFELKFTGGEGSVGQPFSQFVQDGETIQLPANTFTKDGHTFADWLVDGEHLAAGSDYTVTAAKTFEASWSVDRYYVRYMLDDVELTGDYAPAEHAYGSEVAVLALYVKTGYDVTIWTTSDAVVSEGVFTMPAADVVFSATSSAKTYTVTLMARGGDSDRVTTATYDSAVLTAFQPITMAGNNLVGYYAPNYTSMVIASEGTLVANVAGYTDGDGKWIKDGNVELWALWEAISQAIVLDKNGGNADGSITVTYESSAVSGFTTVTKTGNTLTGFFTAASEGTKVINADGTLVPGVSNYTDADGNWIDAGFGKLYAQWTAEVYDIDIRNNTDSSIIGHATVAYGATSATITDTPVRAGYAVQYYSVVMSGTRVMEADGSLVAGISDYTDAQGRWVMTEYVQLIPVWTVIPYDLVLDKNGGDTDGSATVYYGNTYVYDRVDVTRAHYDLLGYFTAPEDGVLVLDASSSAMYKLHTADGYVDEDHKWCRESGCTLYAHWQLQSHQLTIHYVYADSSQAHYDYDGAITYGGAYNIASPSITGYTSDMPGVSGIMGDDDVVVTVTYTVNQYTITFDSNGGTAVAPITQDYNTAVSAPASPTRDGYAFSEWQKAGVAYQFTTMPAENITLVAAWNTVPYTITYELSGGTNSPSNPASYDIETPTFQLADATRTGYDFGGWYSDSGCTSAVTQVTVGSTDDMILYAKWVPQSYDLVLDSTGTDGSAGVTFDSAVISDLVDASVTGYNVIGYNTEGGALVIDAERHLVPSVEGYTDADGKWVRSQGATLAAVTEIQVHTLTINYEYSAGVPAADPFVGQFQYGQAYNVVSPAVIGYTPGNPAVTGTMDVVDIEVSVLYTVNTYTIRFDGNGGSPAGVLVDVEYGAPITDVPDAPVREGYVFKGWDPAVPATMPASDITVKAVWSAIPVSPSEEVIEFDDPTAETVVIDLSVPEVAEALNNASKTEVDLKGDGWAMEIPKSVITGASGNVSASAKTLSDADKDALPAEVKELVKDKTVFSLNLSDSNGAVTFVGNKIKVTLPYELKAGENPKHVQVFYIDGDKAVGVDSEYDEGKGTVTFETDHFSTWFVDTVEPESNGGGFPIWIVAVIIVIAALVAVIVLMKMGIIPDLLAKKS